MGWVRVAAITVGVVLASWVVLVALARSLPPGTSKELARFLPDCATLLRRLLRSDQVSRRHKALLVGALLWVLSPIDLVPEFLPVIGPLDDVVVVALVLRHVARRADREVVLAAWPGNPDVLRRLLGAQ